MGIITDRDICIALGTRRFLPRGALPDNVCRTFE